MYYYELAGLVAVSFIYVMTIITYFSFSWKKSKAYVKISDLAINYHFTRKCNYKCGFCFHTETSSYKLPLSDAKKVIMALSKAGCKMLNFAGGEPFLPEHRDYLGKMVQYAKEICKFESVSIISNGRYVTDDWFKAYHEYLDILGISCDSSDDAINTKIGRGKDDDHIKYVRQAAALCRKFNVNFKLNTVVNQFNYNEDMSALVNELQPMRWKIFQVLGLKGENNGRGAKRDVSEFLISSEQFTAYVDRHKANVINADNIMKVEDNDTMRSSYVLVDEYGRFLDSSTGGKIPTSKILEVGVLAAWEELIHSAGGGFDKQAFINRDGMFYAQSSSLTQSQCDSDVIDIEDLMK